jgi:hypothetical protein
MSLWRKIAESNFAVRLTHWEYWPFGIVQFPAMVYWLWLSLKARSIFFFSASNPGIPMGGMFGESKFEILKNIPAQYVPRTIRISLPASASDALRVMSENGFQLPVVFKPDIGERGYMVERILEESQIVRYLSTVRVDFLVQEIVDLPQEFGVFYRRFPDQENGEVISIVMKEMLSVTGDGASTLRELILSKPRAKLQWHVLEKKFQSRLAEVPAAGEKLELVSIGNHARGTKFINGNHLISQKLSGTFDEISKNVPGFFFGRYDLRCSSADDLESGKIQIMELNGCGAEQAHIYDPDFSLWEAIAVNVRQWSDIYRIYRQNRKNGTRVIPFKEARVYYRKFKHATRE